VFLVPCSSFLVSGGGTGLILQWGIFGVDMNVWLDAFLRLQIVVIVMTVTVMGLIYLERKFVGRIQMRLGPMRTGPFGTLQSIADALKLLTKEDVRPSTADFWLFELAPYVTFVPVFMTLLALPFMDGWFVRELELGLFYIVAISGVTVIGYLMAGWASDNKYALLGAVRSAAQLISYELPLILAVLAVGMVAGSLHFSTIVRQQDVVPNVILQPLPFLILLTAVLAELSRRPFDIPIGESELVGGPWVEYSGIRWSIIFALTEYAGLWAFSIIGALIFLGGWQWPFGTAAFWGDFAFLYQLVLVFTKSFFIILTVMWISATFPRLRVDQLMAFCWKILLPFGFLQIVINGIVLAYEPSEEVRDVILFLTSSALLVAMAYVIYLATRQPSREERVGALAARSTT
jgi:NADH-quinone oxidoreductase subunit H